MQLCLKLKKHLSVKCEQSIFNFLNLLQNIRFFKQKIAEDLFKAYAVLSIESSRIDYDTPRDQVWNSSNYKSAKECNDKVLVE